MLIDKKNTLLFNSSMSTMLVLLIVYCQTVHTKDLYTLGASSSSTSDNIDLDSVKFSYLNNQREHFWPYVKSADSEYDWGVNLHYYDGQANGTDFRGHHLEGVFGFQISEISYIGGSIGLHNLDVPDLDNQKERNTYNIFTNLGLTNNFSLLFSIADNYVYQYGLQPAATREFLNAEMRTAGFQWKPFNTIRISGASTTWDLSDSNTKRETKARILYGISPGWPWIWIGVSYEKLKYEIVKPDYWTPENFRSVGLVFESSFPISDNLTGAVAASTSNVKEDNNPKGNGNSINLGLDYKLTEAHTLRLGFDRIVSQQKKSTWSENTYKLSVNGSF